MMTKNSPIHNYSEMIGRMGTRAVRTVAVAAAHDVHTLQAVLRANEEGRLDYMLTGHPEEILAIGRALGHEVPGERIVPAETEEECAYEAVRLIREGQADFLLKGYLQTGTLLKAVLNKETGISLGQPMSHTALLEIPAYHKILGVTDGGMIPAPDLEMKKAILRNALELFRGLGYEKPVVCVACASEVVSPKIQETVDAAALKKAALAGEFGECIVEGPISLDLSVNKASAEHKHYDSPAAGEADILLVPNITAGNIFVKGLLEFAGAKMAGLVTGAKCPIALNSRSATEEEKYAALMACAGMIPED